MANVKTQTADKKTTTANTVAEQKPVSLVPQNQTSMMKTELPDYLAPTAAEGSEHIERDDMLLPRLALAQKISYELESSHEKFIDGLKEGELFNTVSKNIYGSGPIEFVIIRADRPRFVEFHPRASGGGIKDIDVPANDPRTQFTKGPNGETVPPVATKFYDFIVLLLPSTPGVTEPEMIGLSFKSTGLKTARLLNTLVQQRGKRPIYAGKYVIGVSKAKNAKGIYHVYTVKNSPFANEFSANKEDPRMSGWVSQDVFGFAKEQFEAMKDRIINIDATTETAEDASEGDASFEPAQYDGEVQNPTDM
jgi:hypothetical protein